MSEIICPKCQKDIAIDVHGILSVEGPVPMECPYCKEKLQIRVEVETE